jgi:hypothetical protein
MCRETIAVFVRIVQYTIHLVGKLRFLYVTEGGAYSTQSLSSVEGVGGGGDFQLLSDC